MLDLLTHALRQDQEDVTVARWAVAAALDIIQLAMRHGGRRSPLAVYRQRSRDRQLHDAAVFCRRLGVRGNDAVGRAAVAYLTAMDPRLPAFLALSPAAVIHAEKRVRRLLATSPAQLYESDAIELPGEPMMGGCTPAESRRVVDALWAVRQEHKAAVSAAKAQNAKRKRRP